MLLSRRFFNEDTFFPFWVILLAGLQIALDIAGYLQVDCDFELTSACTYVAKEANLNTVVFSIVPSSTAALFFCLALFWTLRDWRTDLVEQRRQFRRLFVTLLGIFGLIVVVVEDLSLNIFPTTYPLVTNIDSVIVSMLYFVASLLLFRVDAAGIMGELGQTTTLPNNLSAKSLRTQVKTNPQLAQILDFIHRGGYRQAGLSISALAAELGIPQHRLRQLINKELGFRNFNSFLNHYRIEDARKQLADPTKDDASILDIALNVGFGSITSFNDAFKAQVHTSPSAYRKENRV